nr:hypothetical protein BHI3_13100 [Bacteriovorax sp. HI3]
MNGKTPYLLVLVLLITYGCEFSSMITEKLFLLDSSQTSSLASDNQQYLYRSIRYSYVITSTNNRNIERIDLATGEATTIAGNNLTTQTDGIGLAASFSNITDIVYIEGSPGMLYIAEPCKIRRLNTQTLQVSTVVGNNTCSNTNGTGTSARLNGVKALAASGNTLYVASANYIKQVSLNNFAVTNFVGNNTGSGYVDAIGDNAYLNDIVSLTAMNGKLYIAEIGNQLIRTADISTKEVTTLIGNANTIGQQDGTTLATFNFTPSTRLTNDGEKTLFLTELNKVRKVLNEQIPEVITINQQGAEAQDIDGDLSSEAKVYYPSGIVYTAFGLFLSNRYGVRVMR